MNTNNTPTPQIFVGATLLDQATRVPWGEYVSLFGDTFYKIGNFDALEPFFMSIVSSSNHWLYISSSGGLSAGRVSAEQALFPYYTVDKLTENSENTGNKAIFLVTREDRTSLWEPFSDRHRGTYRIERNLYKNVAGTTVLFEERNHSLGLTYRYAWRTSERFGFAKTTWLQNQADSACWIELLDGLQNILPANVPSSTQNTLSVLLDAYKRSELDVETGLGIFALNATLTDLAEPSESLLATTVALIGLEPVHTLLSSAQLDAFRSGSGVATETDIRGQRGAYFAHAHLALTPGEGRGWHVVADVSQDSAAIARLADDLRELGPELPERLERDIALNRENLEKTVASADGLQLTRTMLSSAHHFANVMFNVMRGGAFADGYHVRKGDFEEFVSVRSRAVMDEQQPFFAQLPPETDIFELNRRAEASGSPDLIRLSYAYLPLTFSRRHGDPSRPWNRFAINIKKADGTLRLDYEGNWRDIFQNWEALAYSYPEYIAGMIHSFLSATTADGYNPYRLTRAGMDWEAPEAGNPWANIGYWSDHQIIYLQKLMEVSEKAHPGQLRASLDKLAFSYANVPYRIKPYAELQNDPYNTILFDHALEREIEARAKSHGTDGKLAYGPDGRVLHRSLAEKLLTLLLAKLVNFVPEGGIWMNTQRPEWNDANNALVGKGLSVVTLGYLRRHICFFRDLLGPDGPSTLRVGQDVARLFRRIAEILAQHRPSLAASFTDEARRAMMDALGQAGSDYRWGVYERGLTAELAAVPSADLAAFLDLAGRYVEHSLRANRRVDGLYHAYNTLSLAGKTASVGHLHEMLEGQVSILSSGLLTGDESLQLLESLRHGPLYRPDQHTYTLYPDKNLPGFQQKNTIAESQVRHLRLIAALTDANDARLITRDVHGAYHFASHLRNAQELTRVLDSLARQPEYSGLVAGESEPIKALYESVFHHTEFTGRSGTFFAYEGLGSVYWHMVSKLLLAVQETIFRCRNERSVPGLIARYQDIRAGLGSNKSPAVYGAFPTDPYSHSPKGQGAKQPGMTGMVKEEILTRLAELGLAIREGRLVFEFDLLDRNEMLVHPKPFRYWGVDGQHKTFEVPARALAYSFCQVPIVLRMGDTPAIEAHLRVGGTRRIAGHVLDAPTSASIFRREGAIERLEVTVPPS